MLSAREKKSENCTNMSFLPNVVFDKAGLVSKQVAVVDIICLTAVPYAEIRVKPTLPRNGVLTTLHERSWCIEGSPS